MSNPTDEIKKTPETKTHVSTDPAPEKTEHNETTKGDGKVLSTYDHMDDNNKKAADIMVTQGMDKAVEFMFTHPETGQPMDYATMRYYYG